MLLGEALLVDCCGGGGHLARNADDKRGKLHGVPPVGGGRCGERDLLLDGGSRRHSELDVPHRQTGEEDLHRHVASPDVGKPALAIFVGERLEVERVDHDAGVGHVAAAGFVENAALDGAGAASGNVDPPRDWLTGLRGSGQEAHAENCGRQHGKIARTESQ